MVVRIGMSKEPLNRVKVNTFHYSKRRFKNETGGGKIIDLKKALSTALNEAAIENFRFHDLRHTFASWLVMNGVDLYTVQRLLGHTDIRTTMRYAHNAPGYLEQEIGKIDEILSSEKVIINAASESVDRMVV